jgi:phage shock protein PspC (stress-responsive transcriptional regulator)
MSEFIRKLTSRKFLLALVGVVSGLAMAFGVEGSEITEVVSTVAGIVTALGSIVAYNVAEAKVDAAAAAVLEDVLTVEGVELEDIK